MNARLVNAALSILRTVLRARCKVSEDMDLACRALFARMFNARWDTAEKAVV